MNQFLLFMEHCVRIYRSILINIKETFGTVPKKVETKIADDNQIDLTKLYYSVQNPVVSENVFRTRIRCFNMTPHEAMNTPLRSTEEMKALYGKHLNKIYERLNFPLVSYRQFCRRVSKLNMPLEEALLTPADKR